MRYSRMHAGQPITFSTRTTTPTTSAHNPFKLAEKQTVAVQIDSILKTSPHGYQVRWTETQRDLNGVVPGHRRIGKRARRQIEPPNSRDNRLSAIHSVFT